MTNRNPETSRNYFSEKNTNSWRASKLATSIAFVVAGVFANPSPIGSADLKVDPKKETSIKVSNSVPSGGIMLAQINTFRRSLADKTAPLELSLEEARKTGRIIDSDNFHLWVTKNGEEPQHIEVPVNLDLNKDITISTPHGQKLTVKRIDKNGYNTEFKILEKGKPWTISGLIYTFTTPEYRETNKELSELKGQIGSIEKALTSKKLSGKKAAQFKKQLHSLQTQKGALEAKLQGIKKNASIHYVPYQEHLNTPENRTKGMRHIGDIMEKAFDGIRKVGSTNIKTGKTKEGTPIHIPRNIASIEQIVAPELVLLLNIIERMGYYDYFSILEKYKIKRKVNGKIIEDTRLRGILKSKPEIDLIMKKQVEKTLTVFALNENEAFCSQKSGEGASGIGQIMPDSHTSLRDKYSVLQFPGIQGNYDADTKDQLVSLKYQIMHIYDEYYSLPRWIRDHRNEIMQDPQAKAGLYIILAVAYNGSISNVIKEAGLNTPDTPDITKLYPERLKKLFALNPNGAKREKPQAKIKGKTKGSPKPEQEPDPYVYNLERLTYAMKTEILFKYFFQN